MIDTDAWLAAIETSRIATAIAGSLWLTGLLSAVHLVGMTVLTGGAVVSGLRLTGVLLTDRPVVDVAGAVARGMLAGLAISVASGLLLVASRLSTALSNELFQIKMGLLLVATLVHVMLYRPVSAGMAVHPVVRWTTGAVGLTLWVGVALAGCAFILLE